MRLSSEAVEIASQSELALAGLAVCVFFVILAVVANVALWGFSKLIRERK